MSDFETKLEMFEVFRIKIVYEAAVRDLTGRRVLFPIDSEMKAGPGNLKQFRRIVRKLKSMGAEIEDFIGVLFNHFNWPRKVHGRVWNYPYLSFIASDGGMAMFRWGAKDMKGGYKKVGVIRSVIRSGAGGTLEARFTGCFYSGFDYLYTAVEQFGVAFFRDHPINLLAFFLANNQLFTPEYIAINSSFRKMLKSYNALRGMEKKLARVVIEHVADIRKRADYDRGYHRRLTKAYVAVRDREGKDIERLRSHKENWRIVWQMVR